MNTRSIGILAIVMAAATSAAWAQDASHAGHGAHGARASHGGERTAAASDLTEGEVKKIDREAGKITMRHAEIRNLDMGAMTMVLRVKDPAMLEQVQVGDKVRFAAERVNGAVTIVRLESAQ